MKVHLWGELGFYGPDRQGRFEVRIREPMQIAEALALIGVPVADVAVLGHNGDVVRPHDATVIVTDADRIDCFPATSGG
ncbi:MAG: MoaD/ThiS family protein [Chloroflexota bacterium]